MSTYINVSCHCALHRFRVEFDTESLPISSGLCHCSTCRHSTGQLATWQVPIRGVPLQRRSGRRSRSVSPSPSDSPRGYSENMASCGHPYSTTDGGHSLAPPPMSFHHSSLSVLEEEPAPYDFTHLSAYEITPNLTTYFCDLCSAHLLQRLHAEEAHDSWFVSVGALDHIDGIAKLAYHRNVAETLDGGLADHLRVVDGIKLPRYSSDMGSSQLPVGWRAESLGPHAPNENLPAFCNCGAIKFEITRPSEVSSDLEAPYPDFIHPYDTTHLSVISNLKDEKWWLRPQSSLHPTKYFAGHCMCKICRLCSGFEVQSWNFIPLANLVRPGTEIPLNLEDDDHRPAHLKQYIVSPGTYREFCDVCGATVFAWRIMLPDLVNVSMALLDEKVAGARAEDWIEWCRERVCYKEQSRSFPDALEAGLKMA